MWTRLLLIAVAAIGAWGALAQVAPHIFVVGEDSPMNEWLWGAKTIWLALPIITVLLMIHFWRLETRMSAIERPERERDRIFQKWLSQLEQYTRQEFKNEFARLVKDTLDIGRANKKAIENFGQSYDERLSDLESGVSERGWITVVIDRKRIRMTADAQELYLQCDEAHRRRLEQGLHRSTQYRFTKTDIETLSAEDHA